MRHRKGFTLVELLFVTAIIGIVAAILAPALIGVKRRARAIQCAHRLSQVGLAIHVYLNDNNSVIPFINTGPEAQPHPKRAFQPSTGVPSLRQFLIDNDYDPVIARCPSDTGAPNQSFHPTPYGVSCFEDWGQSMLYNGSCYRETDAPGYVPGQGGPLFGARPVKVDALPATAPSTYILAGDFWPHWHFGAAPASKGGFYTNVLFYDFHVEGRHYASEEEGLAYLDWDGVRRWWVPDPPPFRPPE
jgi:prepilin-type N-terminal cleavage/methylation domain-containing protein/prepilin-type processing-associated H-X9-DG protein